MSGQEIETAITMGATIVSLTVAAWGLVYLRRKKRELQEMERQFDEWLAARKRDRIRSLLSGD